MELVYLVVTSLVEVHYKFSTPCEEVHYKFTTPFDLIFIIGLIFLLGHLKDNLPKIFWVRQ